MNTEAVIAALNEAIALEHAASMQYKQQSLLVRGLWRAFYAERFAASAREAFDHAEKFGQKVVSLGGLPTLDVAPIRQAVAIDEMLAQDLEVERKALAAYQRALALASGDIALCSMLEDQIEAETKDVEELELVLEQVKTVVPPHDVTLHQVG